MTLIKLKDDNVNYLRPYCYVDDFNEGNEFFPIYYPVTVLSVIVEFDNSESMEYERIVEDAEGLMIADIISYLFSDTSKFSELSAEKFKYLLKRYLDKL